MDTLLRRCTAHAFECFLIALHDTNNGHIADKLKQTLSQMNPTSVTQQAKQQPDTMHRGKREVISGAKTVHLQDVKVKRSKLTVNIN